MFRFNFLFFLFILSLFLFEERAYAYLDPSTGSYLFQLFAGFLIGIAIFFKQIVDFIKGIFNRLKYHGKNKQD